MAIYTVQKHNGCPLTAYKGTETRGDSGMGLTTTVVAGVARWLPTASPSEQVSAGSEAITRTTLG